MTDKKLFDVWFAEKADTGYMLRLESILWFTWQAATAAERERAARVCESLGMTTNGIYERNQECADKIRSGE